MSFLILVRHGQSIWNLENKFTGWVDVDLTKKGESEAEKAGLLIKKKNIQINFYYSSLQLRANNTLKIIQTVLNDKKDFVRAWQLNERHYGALTGLNKIEMSKKIGEEKVYEFRRSWDIKPDALKKESPYHPENIKIYKNIEVNYYYSSLQLRANNTLKIIQNVLNDKKDFTRAWQLNERHYGALTGLNKVEMSKKIGEQKVHEFRRSWDIKPEPLDRKNSYHPINIEIYKDSYISSWKSYQGVM